MSDTNVVEQTGVYLLFARYHDATHDPVPRREVPNPLGDIFTPRLVMDETEWLARPDLWGVELFSVHKRHLAEHYSFHWLAEQIIHCQVCQPLVRRLYPDTGFDDEWLFTPEWEQPPLAENRKWRSVEVPPRCTCGTWSLYRRCRMRALGVITGQELQHFVAELLDSHARIEVPSRELPAVRERFRLQRQSAWDYGRNLALELCGPNPFRPVAFDPRWRSESAVSLARTAYDTRDFTLLPILADALEEAGCDNADVLTHCRGDGPHVRGCWVVDGVLGKQ
jgi:hypothetical protein